MKILLMTWKDPKHPLAGGAELVNDEMCMRLVRDGHEVIALVGGFADAPHKAQMHGYQIIRVGNRYTLWWEAFRYYQKHLRGWADLIIEEINTAPFFTAWYAREPKVLLFHQLCRQIWFYHMPAPFNLMFYLAEPLYLRMLGRGPVITVSESTKADLVRHGIDESRISIISEAINIAPVKHLKTPKYAEPTLLSFGAIRPMKRTLHHVEAFDIAKQTMPELKLIIAGASEGNYGQKVMDRIASSPFRADITVLGRPTDAEKTVLFRKSHLFLVTSVKEGWGIVVSEAASQGTPSVAYNVDGLRDSVRHGHTGIVTDPNPHALASGIVAALADQKAYEAMRTNGWRWSHELTFDKMYADFWVGLQRALPAGTVLEAEGVASDH